MGCLRIKGSLCSIFHLCGFNITYSNPRYIFTYTYLADLRNHPSLFQSLCNLNVEGTTLLWIGKVFSFGKLEFPILLDKRVNHNRIVVKRSAVNGGEQD